MKLTNPESIQDSEKEFIDTINAELDWDVIEQMLLDKHNFAVQDDIEYKDGNLIVYNNEIAYKFDFQIKVPLSVIFNRGGECLSMSTTREEEVLKNNEDVEVQNSSTTQTLSDEPGKNKVEAMAVEIADLISEINNKA
ncbi:hypothetical protein DO021_13980 [Desulfobacter hydrogenophilus]|uniref:Uncharacterized protein n=1 Tax=Desulfobacter hydrogenophilus TaxID=2291 RepID=A0A328FE52_9BACT|nr:hypothetical protein [Desulfobacter hydrogenophilus]NDY72094.1 hypothetical protein [Desulfobacter hydrogenophilus]QBH14819.1 hypothetical protein EYB58_19010 [Desulfobacter hydrogenophilus]RAM01327.1 hypothetical protein DO021_13980 [Desulfobacter hydrogenophilus]